MKKRSVNLVLITVNYVSPKTNALSVMKDFTRTMVNAYPVNCLVQLVSPKKPARVVIAGYITSKITFVKNVERIATHVTEKMTARTATVGTSLMKGIVKNVK